MKIAFFDTKEYDRQSFNSRKTDTNVRIKYFETKLTADSVVLTKGYDAVCAFVNDTIDKTVIDGLVENGVKLITMRCAGYNNVDLKYALSKIHVVRVPAYSPYAVAEHALALIMTLNRKTHKAFNRTRDSNFNINGLVGFDLHGKTAGIIGAGKIGRIMIDLLKGLGMNVLAFDNWKDEEYARKKGFKYVGLDRLYRESDIISLHCPLTKESRHMINGESISHMKDNVMIINTSRGHLINTGALIEGLKTGKVGYAGLDVYEEESSYFFEDFSASMIMDDILARLLTFNNVLITSHQAFLTTEALENISTTTLESINSFFKSEKLENEICYQCTTDKPCPKDKTGKCF
ncbi:MAG: 2-hydroxyacid dehydrogenase [Spirochaetaceae bacterium]|nr:2-hydroxyacid dehydrogenase [Spirochaetaceae bacterium]